MILVLLTLALPANFDKVSFCDTARSIRKEAGSNAAAEKLALERGYDRKVIWLAKKICRPQ